MSSLAFGDSDDGVSATKACFVIPLRDGANQKYIERHSPVWPEMLEALERAGWRNYSLFLDPRGFVIGYFEADDLEAAVGAMEAEDVNTRWQASTAHLFDGALTWLPKVFDLNLQLKAIR